MHVTDEEIIKEARSWLKPFTPWKHGVAKKGWGADCIQFVVELCKTFKWLPLDFKTPKYAQDYAEHNTFSILKEGVAQYAKEVALEDIKVGDVILYTFAKTAGHAGMYIGNGEVIHCHIRNGVTTTPLAAMMDKFDSLWRCSNE